MNNIPKHRAGFASRDGDTRVIEAGGKVRNVDAEARKTTQSKRAAAAAEAKPAPGDIAPGTSRKKRPSSDGVSAE